MTDPIFHITPEILEAGMKVVRRAGGMDDEAVLAGAFMAMLSEREDGAVLFGWGDDSPVFRFSMKGEN